jgi:poly(3-hydroxyalkanoate) depolymerase
MLNEYFEWRGHRIHVQERGDGEPLLLINGLGANTDMWAPLASHFRDRRVLLFDAPGTGRSSTPKKPVTVAELAVLAVAVLDNRGVETADVLGYSYGGAIAQQLAHDAPERIRRLVLAATNCGVGALLGSPQAMFVLSTPFRYYSKSYFYRIAASLYGGRTARNLEVRHRMMNSRSKYPPSSLGYTLQIMGGASWTSRDFLHELEPETLVLSGDDDPLIPICNAEYLAGRIPNATLELVEEAGHLFLCDDARRMSMRIRKFIGPHPQQTRQDDKLVAIA